MAVTLLLYFLQSAAFAQSDDMEVSPLTLPELNRYLEGAVIGVILHETGHALFDLYDLPIVGPEEDAADEFATMFMIEQVARSPEGHQLALSFALYFHTLWQQFLAEHQAEEAEVDPSSPTDVFDPWIYWDDHNIDQKRAYNTLCLLYGAFPETYDILLTDLNADDKKKASCRALYPDKREAWDRLLTPYMRTPTDAETGSANSTTIFPQFLTEGPRFVVFQEPTAKPIGRFYQNSHLGHDQIELIAQLVNMDFPVDTIIPIVSADCGVENAFWDPEKEAMLFCRELLDLMVNAYVEWRTGQSYDVWLAGLSADLGPSWLAGKWRTEERGLEGIFSAGRDMVFSKNGTYRWVDYQRAADGTIRDWDRQGLYGFDGDTLWLVETDRSGHQCFTETCPDDHLANKSLTEQIYLASGMLPPSETIMTLSLPNGAPLVDGMSVYPQTIFLGDRRYDRATFDVAP